MDDDKKSNNVCSSIKKAKQQNFPKSQKTFEHPDAQSQKNEPKINSNPKTKPTSKPYGPNRANPKQEENKLRKKSPDKTDRSERSRNNGAKVGHSKNSTNFISKKFGPRKPGMKSENKCFDEPCEEHFEIEDIMGDSKAMELIEDVLNSLISNSTLPANELEILKVSLFERICAVFLNILNNSMEKIFIRVLNSDLIQELRKTPVLKKDACCQTSFTHTSKGEESSCSSVVNCAKLQSPR